MIYTIIEPPIYVQHNKMSRSEAKYFYDWFIASIPNRIEILSIAIETSDVVDSVVSLNKDFNSLKGLGNWFKVQSKHRLKTDEEKHNQTINLSQKQKALLPLVDVVLSEKTLSLVTDIGMYCGEVLINEISGAKWELYVPKQTKNINYQQPIITGINNNNVCNPIYTVLNVASKFAWNTVEGEELYERFVHWKN